MTDSLSADHTAPRTSLTHPLAIAAVSPGPRMGRLGVTFCPGKVQPDAESGAWARDLARDLDTVRDWGAAVVVTLVEEHELAALGVERMGEEVAARHMAWRHLPIRDVSIPGEHFERRWRQEGAFLRRVLRAGFDVVVHCKGGLGRAGMIAARLLVELGMEPVAAIAAVRDVRPGAIETREQERHVVACRALPLPTPSRATEAVRDRALGALVGLAVGDAVGTTLEFCARDRHPRLTDMVGGGPFDLKAGEWTDDTAMALALADSLIACDGLDEAHLMARFADWMDHGAWSCTGTCFDIGMTTRDALRRWKRSGHPVAGSTDPDTAGNGSLMRLAPVALRHWDEPDRLIDAAARQSRTTHGAATAVDACIGYAAMLARAIAGEPLEAVLAQGDGQAVTPEIARVLAGSWRGKARGAIRGSGYVVESLEAALWCVARAGSFEEAVLAAANLGDDADTTAAIAGQLAGATWGLSGIPAYWLDRLAWRTRIVALGEALLERRA